MRILQVLPHLSKGGAERVVVELSNSLVTVDHEITLLLAFPVNLELNLQFLSKKVHVKYLMVDSTNRTLVYLKLPFYLIRHWKNLKTYEVIHCHLTFGLVFGSLMSFGRKITRSKGPRLVATCHVVGLDISRIQRIINEKFSVFFDVFALMAQDAKWRNLISHAKKSNIHIVVNGITVSGWNSQLKKFRKKSSLTVGTISRLQRERKPWLFLEVFARLHELTNGKVRFVLGGEGPERPNLMALAEELNLSNNLSMPGLVQDPKSFLKDLDFYVALNVEDITGIAGLEAVSSGIPTVGIQLSSTYEKGENDWIWSSQDPQIVAFKIANLLENPKKLAKLAKDQHHVAIRDYTIERMRDHYLNLYSVGEGRFR